MRTAFTRTVKVVLAFFAIALPLVLVPLGFLIGSEAGLRWLVTRLPGWSDQRIEISAAEGRLLDELRLSGIRYAEPGITLAVQELRLRWQPKALLEGRFEVVSLSVSGIRAEQEPVPVPADRPPAKHSPDFRIPEIAVPIDVVIDEFRITGVEWHRPDAEPVRIEELRLVASLKDSLLELGPVAVRATEGEVRASGELELKAPHPLKLSVDWQWRAPGGEGLGGELEAAGDSGRLRLHHRGFGRIPITMDGEILEPLISPHWVAELSWPSFDLPVADGQPPLTVSEGRLRSEGEPESYRARVEVALEGGGLPQTRWRASVEGGLEGLRIERIEAASPQAAMTASGDVGWAPIPRVALDLTLSGSQLAELHPDLPDTLGVRGRVEAAMRGAHVDLPVAWLELVDAPGKLELQGTLELPPDDLSPEDKPLRVRGELSWAGLQWPLADPQPSISSDSGSLRFEGSPSEYSLALFAELHGDRLGSAQCLMEAEGGPESLEIGRIRADLLGGKVEGQGRVRWAPEIGGRLELESEGVDLAKALPEIGAAAQLRGALSAEVADERLKIEQLDLGLPDLGSRLSVTGEVPVDLAGPLVLEARWQALRWPLAGDAVEIGSTKGKLELQGSVADYRLNLEAELEGSELPHGKWRLLARGDPQRLRLEPLEGELLGGTVRALGEVAWDPEPSWQLDLQGERLDPGLFYPEMAGNLGFKAETRGSVVDGEISRALVRVDRLAGRLRERALSANADAELSGDRLDINGLDLSLGRNLLTAKGRLDGARLDFGWKLQAPDPGALLPGASGALEAQGRVSGIVDAPELMATIDGRGLELAERRLESLSGDLTLGSRPASPVSMHLRANGLKQDGEDVVAEARADLEGTVASHRLSVGVQAETASLEARLRGGLDLEHRHWKGEIASLSAKERELGEWVLRAPAAIQGSPQGARLAEACLRSSSAGALLCTELESAAGGALDILARAEGLDLALLAREASGRVDARVKGRLGAGGELTGAGELTVAPGEVRVETDGTAKKLRHGGGEVTFDVDSRGLQAQLELRPLEQASLRGELRLPGFSRVPPRPGQPLSGRVSGGIPDLAVLQSFVPQLSNLSGELALNLRASGTVEKPVVDGTLRLAGGSADVPDLGVELRDLRLDVAGAPGSPGRLDVSGGVQSGPGALRLSGSVDLEASLVELALAGDRFEVVRLPDARAYVSPDLTLTYNDQGVRLRGSLLIPEAAITPQISISPGLVASEGDAGPVRRERIGVSPDVVVRGGGRVSPESRPASSPPLAIDSQVDVAFGDAVTVDAAGFSCRVAGNVRLTNRPGQRDLLPLAEGVVRIEDGIFRSFGQDLEIERGRIVFTGLPATKAKLDVSAVRRIRGENEYGVTSAGVLISGTLEKPVLELFSRPQVDPEAIRSFLLSGRAPKDEELLLTWGMYVWPKVYAAYGVNLLDLTSQFNVQYDISPRYGVEAHVGAADKNLAFTVTLER